MNIPLFLILCQGIILFLANGATSNPVVQMGNSKVIGKSMRYDKRKVDEFLGIPYARPPTGNLRFKPTLPLKKFPNVYEALHQAPACHQYTETPFPWYMNDTIKSEDCLHLDIWKPADASPSNLKAVLYFIFSGQFRLGSNTPSFYSGLALAGEGDIVVVTVSYRLGAFGFLYTGTDDAPGNAGLYDVLSGLKWVNDNIQSYGGDPSQITICGHSSSADIAGRLAESPMAIGLYSKLIMWSGSPANLQTEFKDINLNQSKTLAKMVGCATEDQDVSDPAVNRCLKSNPLNSVTDSCL